MIIWLIDHSDWSTKETLQKWFFFNSIDARGQNNYSSFHWILPNQKLICEIISEKNKELFSVIGSNNNKMVKIVFFFLLKKKLFWLVNGCNLENTCHRFLLLYEFLSSFLFCCSSSTKWIPLFGDVFTHNRYGLRAHFFRVGLGVRYQITSETSFVRVFFFSSRRLFVNVLILPIKMCFVISWPDIGGS